jgi:hypothetical protein
MELYLPRYKRTLKHMHVFCYDQIKVEPVRAGYSDIRMWPCYGVACALIFATMPFIGLFWAVVLVGIPSFIFMLSLVKIGQKSAHVPQQKAVYVGIKQDDISFNKKNQLLRRNMKIIQEDERQTKAAKRKSIRGRTKSA